MGVILGIDTGGTFTDGVVLDYHTKEVLSSAKAFTTKENLTIGIENCIDKLSFDPGDVCMVSLSTTLATNAVVEGKYMPTGLITIGDKRKEKYPATVTVNIRGKQDVMGRELQPMYEEEIRQALESMRGKVAALAISGYASVRNPQQELRVCTMAKEILDVPVVCAYELTSALGYYERTVTAVLNARLIPIIAGLIAQTKVVLKSRGIRSQVAVVKGDGHLMIDSFAEEHPVETVLSGPAASMIGGRFLTGLNNAIIVDMGGTTTDIVFVNNGEISLEESGASVGGWKTRVRAVEVKSYGLGGDSYMHLNTKGEIVFEPWRVTPLCVAAAEAPQLYDEIGRLNMGAEYAIAGRMQTDCLRLFRKCSPKETELEPEEQEILRLLADGPHSLLFLAKELETDIDGLPLKRLLREELVQMISMTPTDILHASGRFRQWHHKASLLGMRIYAEAAGVSLGEMIRTAETAFVHRIAYTIMESVLEADGLNLEAVGEDAARFLIESFLKSGAGGNLNCRGDFLKPIIGIGAPARAWIAKAAEYLQAEFILPEHDAVANAIGAAVSDVKETVSAMISYDPHISRYVAFLPGRRMSFETLDEAKRFSREDVRSCAEVLAFFGPFWT